MRIAGFALVLALGCDDRVHHLGAAPGDASSDATGSDGSGSATPALGCALADVVADCGAAITIYTDNTFAECGFPIALGSAAPPQYSYNVNDVATATVTYDRTFTFTCTVGSDDVRAWTPGFTDACESIPANATDFSADHTGAQLQTLPGACPSGRYDVTAVEAGNTAATGMTTCEVPSTLAYLTTTGFCGSGSGSGA
jgi:hypothetical protein